MGKPTLIYFDVTGKAEPVRLAFHIGGVEFEDKRVSCEEFGKLKPELPFGCVPVLQMDGECISQSIALLMYAGSKASLVPENPIELLKVMEIVMGYEDIIALIAPSLKESDAEKKKEMRAALVADKLPFMFDCMEKVVCRHGKKGFMAGDKLTIADLVNYNMISWFNSGMLDHIPATVFSKCAKLNEGFNLVSKLPKVKEWREKHPLKKAATNGA